MALKEDQAIASDPELLGRFIAAVKFVAAQIVEEAPLTPNHLGRMGVAKRAMFERQSENYGRVILELAIASNAKLIQARAEVADQDVIDCVAHYMDIFAREGW